MIALTGAIQESLQSPRCTPNCLQHECSSGQGAFVCKSHATHRALIMCNMSCATGYKGTAQLSSLIELNRISALFYWLKQLTDEGGEATEYL